MKQLRFVGGHWAYDWVRPCLLLFLMTLLLLAACGGSEPAAEPEPEPETAVVDEPVPEDEPPAPTATPKPEPTLTASEHLERGVDLAESENFDEAIVELQAALEQEPDNTDALASLGGVYLTLERLEEAMVELDKALAIEADHPLALSNLCGTLALQGAENALNICEQALAENPEDADVYNSLGILYGQAGQFEPAVAAFLEAIDLEPEHNWAHNNLGRTYINMNQFEQSIPALSEAIRIDPDNAKAHYNLGLAYANLERYEDAIPAYQEALQQDPNLVYTYIDLAVVYTWMEQPEEAIANFEAFLEMVPDADNREAIEAEIARLSDLAAMGEAVTSDGTVDFSDPVSVLNAVFFAAAAGDFTNLAGLCDPLGENDGDTALICAITADHDAVNDFVAYFGNGRVNGLPLINGDQAELSFLFGPEGDQTETMIFIQRDGQWYLFEF